MTEEPMQHQSNIDNEESSAPPTKVFDYAKIVAERLNQPFDYKNTYGRQVVVELRKKTAEELMEMAEKADVEDSDDEESIVEVHASVGERSIKTLTNIPLVHAFNMAESRLEAAGDKKKCPQN